MRRLIKTAGRVVVFLLLLSVSTAQTLSIYHIDVNQGDSTLLVSPSGKTLLVDGGQTGKGTEVVFPLLRSLKIATLDYIVATHYDEDHIGGLDEVIRAYGQKIGVILDRGPVKSSSPPYKEYRAVLGGLAKPIKPGDRLDMGAEIEVVCVAVNQDVLGGLKVSRRGTGENEKSVALVVRFKDFGYFIGGDMTGGGRSGSSATPNVERLAAGIVGDVDVLRASHHGSQTSSSAAFLNALQPEVVVISVGDGGKNGIYHHPHRVVLTRLRALPSLKTIFMTHRGETTGGLTAQERKAIRVANGNVVLVTDGRSYSVNGTVFPTDGVRSLDGGAIK